MLSDGDRASLTDIAFNIDLAFAFAEGLDYQRFADDLRTVYAITRCLEIISEASRRLSSDLKERHPDIPWRKIAGSGNIYRHDYEDVVQRLVWERCASSFPTLRPLCASNCPLRSKGASASSCSSPRR